MQGRKRLWWWAALVLGLPGLLCAQGQLINGNRTLIGSLNLCADAGATDAYACSLSPAIPAYRTGTQYTFTANTANTGAATLNLNGLGAKTIKKMIGSAATDLVTGDILVGQYVTVQYDGAIMQLVTPPAALPTVIASGSKTLNTTTVTSGTCGSAQTATATGTLTTDLVLASLNGDVTAVTGYTGATTGTLRVDAYPTTDTINFKVCNGTASDITPGGITFNWRVLR